MKLKIIPNSDKEIVKEIDSKLRESGGNCPCVLPTFWNNDTLCPCKEFREQSTEGFCHCQKYQKVNVDG